MMAMRGPVPYTPAEILTAWVGCKRRADVSHSPRTGHGQDLACRRGSHGGVVDNAPVSAMVGPTPALRCKKASHQELILRRPAAAISRG